MPASVQDSPRPQASGSAASRARNGTTTNTPMTTRIASDREPSSSGWGVDWTTEATGAPPVLDMVTGLSPRKARRALPGAAEVQGVGWISPDAARLLVGE